MHPSYNSSPFIVKLWKIVGDSSTDELISWNPGGSSFTIHDPERFAKELVPQYFKHGSSSSFIRQLNMYGFKKVLNFGKITGSRELEFQHAFFLRDKAELLANIKRKAPASSSRASTTSDSSSTARSVDVDAEVDFSPSDILTNISILREKQKNMDVVLNKIKKENENLWRELVAVTQRHKSQEQVLQKVIQFLVQIIQRSNQNIHVPRKLARMLQDSPISQENSSLVARIVDVFKNKDSDCIYVPDEASSSPLGAVIHEVTDSELDTLRPTQSLSKTKFNTSILKTLPKTDKSSVPSTNTSSTVEPSSILEVPSESMATTSEGLAVSPSPASSSKYVAFPIVGDPNKWCLVPTENFTSQQISSFKPDVFCNVIALPAKVPSSDSASNFKLDQSASRAGTNSTESNTSDLNFSHVLDGANASDNILADYSLINNDLSSLVLSDLIPPKNITPIQERLSDCLTVDDTLMDEESPSVPESSLSQQLAVPQPSRLGKSNICYPDFSILQDPVISPSGSNNTRVLEKLFGSDEDPGWDSLLSQLPNEKDVFMNNTPEESILGNELVHVNPTSMGDTMELDPQQLLDVLNQEWSDTDLNQFRDSFCSPRDTDVLISSIKPSGLDFLKNETMLTTPPRRSCDNEKNKKRRKMK